MEEHHGHGRGSYIWGKSVHNTRIERLWCDVTNGFGRKWKKFFVELEANYGLIPTRSEHIWLLHFLFLECINQDAHEWARTWNNHKLQIAGERERSPRDMFTFGMVQQGPRGISTILAPEDDDLDADEVQSYGIDWEAMADTEIMQHHLEHNPDQWEDTNPFSSTTTPSQLSEVVCDAPNCPLSAQELATLTQHLHATVDIHSSNMIVRRMLWQQALLCCSLFWRPSIL
ncbi:hypothetical protein PUNSTDRAFT_62888 [Punctularia strigosozonata HHB-11173 SS5]|uniref:uncharacterized protein n=1 Tax=Punctularia strigosozonata (strain HHB-11173) TaxID=741275 RepID=UPI0004417150|nr:uncharacterized protein PUNSTDRAFT_62888 [Punctularia strigosozonata HHB-11173 SS5]EIN11639.1 hypothetical protein PUNSTDRAFT_62888 [Punctularia strigosozonata HHB-11173 SS5]